MREKESSEAGLLFKAFDETKGFSLSVGWIWNFKKAENELVQFFLIPLTGFHLRSRGLRRRDGFFAFFSAKSSSWRVEIVDWKRYFMLLKRNQTTILRSLKIISISLVSLEKSRKSLVIAKLSAILMFQKWFKLLKKFSQWKENLYRISLSIQLT